MEIVDSYHKLDPVSELPDWYYPFYRQFVKFMMSCSIMVFMVCLVIASAIGVIVYRVVSRVDYSNNPMEEFVYSTLLSSVLNSVSIMIMGKIYEILAYKLTDWENHRTQTSYDDALIIKLFAFQFVNSYVSLYYIAFFRDETSNDGILDFGPEYEDTCDNNDCMSMLSFQVLVLMLLKPLPKFFKDIILPWFIKNVKKCLRKCKNNKVDEAEKPDDSTKVEMNDFLERERQKPPVGDVSRSPPVGDFTLMEYNEKIIQYGYLMEKYQVTKILETAGLMPLEEGAPMITSATAHLVGGYSMHQIGLTGAGVPAIHPYEKRRESLSFSSPTKSSSIGIDRDIARYDTQGNMHFKVTDDLFACSLPLAPLIALLTNLCDIRVDAKRLLWFNRRPVALVAQDIVSWLVLKLVSSCKLYETLYSQHCVFAIKFLIAYMIPDVPTDVSLSMRREKYQVTKILETAGLMPLEEGAPMITSATAHLVGGYSMHQIGLTGAGVPAIHPYEKRRESLSFSSPTKSSSIGIDRDIARRRRALRNVKWYM
uniref:Anoctamin n=1 Tax=Saccoglossus kowalevskii TaxID=10224 RepID=A0ABM0M916_SACKO|nr:PREDICTED: anoctamin-5-like [Saccoglossus kowalevskii]